MQDLVIIGAGPFGEEMLDNIRWINEEKPRWNILGFVDEERTGDIDGVKILGNLEAFLKMDKNVRYFVASLDGKERERIMRICKSAGFTAAVIVGVKVSIEENVEIGEGCYLGYKTKLCHGSRIGAGVILEYISFVGSEAEIGAYSTCRLYSSVGRTARVGKYNHFDARCTVDDGVATADNCSFKIGTVVLKSINVPGQYVGVPAKLLAAEQ